MGKMENFLSRENLGTEVRIKTVTVRKSGKIYRYSYAIPRPVKRPRPDRMRTGLLLHTVDLWKMARKRVRGTQIPFAITKDDVEQLMRDQEYRCALTGLRFEMANDYGGRKLFRMPLRPSLDRIEPPLGYVAGNVRLICTAMNVALNEWGEDVFTVLARAYIENKGLISRRLKRYPPRPLADDAAHPL